MLSLLLERLLLFFVNVAARPGPAGAAGHHGSFWLNRLFRKPERALAQTSALHADPPVVLGDVVPSAREALRQGGLPAPPLTLTTEIRRRHVYVLGGTGTGKTNLLVQMLDADIAAGRAVCLLDARGDLVDRLLTRLAVGHAPEQLAERLLLLDLRTTGTADDGFAVLGFNPLAQAGGDPYTRAFFVLDVLRQQLEAGLGVQTEETLRNGLLALSMTGGTLLDIEPMLTDGAVRSSLLAGVSDSGVLRFFARFDAMPEPQRGLWVNPVLNKITPWLARPSLKRLLGQRQSVSLRDFLDARPDAILLVCLGADELFGAASLVGSLVVSAVAGAVMRTDRPVRHPLFLYLDEFENFGGAGEQFSAIVSEGRRFGLGLTLSHQSSTQLEPKLRSLIRNVVATQIYFATGGLDAETLAGEIASDEPKTVLRNVLLNQKVGEALVVRRGQAAVRVKTHHAPDPDVAKTKVEALRQASLRIHGRPLSDVEAELRAREGGPDSATSRPDAGKRTPTQASLKSATSPKSSASKSSSKSSASRNKQTSYEVREHGE